MFTAFRGAGLLQPAINKQVHSLFKHVFYYVYCQRLHFHVNDIRFLWNSEGKQDFRQTVSIFIVSEYSMETEVIHIYIAVNNKNKMLFSTLCTRYYCKTKVLVQRENLLVVVKMSMVLAPDQCE